MADGYVASKIESTQRLLRAAEAMDDTLNRIYNLDPEAHATKSRDYGRGFAEALRVVRDEIDTRMGLWAARDVVTSAKGDEVSS